MEKQTCNYKWRKGAKPETPAKEGVPSPADGGKVKEMLQIIPNKALVEFCQ
jgi:hypothetical protein